MDSDARVLRIDCAECTLQFSDWCADCVVTFLCDHQADGAVVVDMAEARALQVIAGGGLAPVLRHHRRTS